MKTNKYIILLLAVGLLGIGELLVAGQQRSGGGGQRGTPNPEANDLRELERALNLTARRVTVTPTTAWWLDTALLTRLGLGDDQKVRIERIFEAHRQNLIASMMQLEGDELALKQLLNAETLDRNAVRAQIDRVIRSRSEMERTNSTMTLEMREQLTQVQWMQLQSQPSWNTPFGVNVGTPGVRGRGQRSQNEE